MLKYKTLSGSVYEVDLDNMKARRLSGFRAPTERQGEDGKWRTFTKFSHLMSGQLLFVWNITDLRAESTLTSIAEEIL